MSKRAALAAALALGTLASASAGQVGPTLAEDLKGLEIKLVDGYAKVHPRLLFGPQDKAALQQKAKTCPDLWSRVLASAKRLGDEAPSDEEITTGAHYWRIERAQSGALAHFVTGDKKHLEAAVRWMVQHGKQPVWGVGWGQNVDLHASWYLYHISLAYDALYNDLSPADRKVIRDGLADHAKAMYESLNPADPNFRYKDGFRYDQNHTYIPAVALATAGLALLDEVPQATDWLKHACAVMRRCRYALGEDGWYYEGTGYWSYATHWHVRYAELIARATGQDPYLLPILKDNWLFPLHTRLPGPPGVFDIGDIGKGCQNGQRADLGGSSNQSMFWRLATALASPQCRLVGDRLDAQSPDNDYPALAFLRFDPAVQPAQIEDIQPYHHFPDHGFVCWRSGWGKDDTVCVFRCGPPAGHSAAAKLGQMTDWVMNCGHTHPDIGAFWLYAKGAYLATDTGYTANKFTRDHNTLTIDGVGQGMDGEYWNERGYPYQRFNDCRMDKVHLEKAYAFASGQFAPAYSKDKVGEVSLRRSVLMSRDWLLVVDDLAAPQAHKLAWYCHADAEFTQDGPAFVARLPKAGLAVIPLGGPAMADHMEKTEVMAGDSPGEGKPEVRGWQLRREMAQPAPKARLVHLLVPLGAGAKPPAASLKDGPESKLVFLLTWPDGTRQDVTVDLSWKPESPGGPATITAGRKP